MSYADYAANNIAVRASVRGGGQFLQTAFSKCCVVAGVQAITARREHDSRMATRNENIARGRAQQAKRDSVFVAGAGPTLVVPLDADVFAVAERVVLSTGLSLADFFLSASNKPLRGDLTLADYNIGANTTLIVNHRLLGGGGVLDEAIPYVADRVFVMNNIAFHQRDPSSTIIFIVIDVSGSMRGARWSAARLAAMQAQAAISEDMPGCKFVIAGFASSCFVVGPDGRWQKLVDLCPTLSREQLQHASAIETGHDLVANSIRAGPVPIPADMPIGGCTPANRMFTWMLYFAPQGAKCVFLWDGGPSVHGEGIHVASERCERQVNARMAGDQAVLPPSVTIQEASATATLRTCAGGKFQRQELLSPRFGEMQHATVTAAMVDYIKSRPVGSVCAVAFGDANAAGAYVQSMAAGGIAFSAFTESPADPALAEKLEAACVAAATCASKVSLSISPEGLRALPVSATLTIVPPGTETIDGSAARQLQIADPRVRAICKQWPAKTLVRALQTVTSADIPLVDATAAKIEAIVKKLKFVKSTEWLGQSGADDAIAVDMLAAMADDLLCQLWSRRDVLAMDTVGTELNPHLLEASRQSLLAAGGSKRMKKASQKLAELAVDGAVVCVAEQVSAVGAGRTSVSWKTPSAIVADTADVSPVGLWGSIVCSADSSKPVATFHNVLTLEQYNVTSAGEFAPAGADDTLLRTDTRVVHCCNMRWYFWGVDEHHPRCMVCQHNPEYDYDDDFDDTRPACHQRHTTIQALLDEYCSVDINAVCGETAAGNLGVTFAGFVLPADFENPQAFDAVTWPDTSTVATELEAMTMCTTIETRASFSVLPWYITAGGRMPTAKHDLGNGVWQNKPWWPAVLMAALLLEHPEQVDIAIKRKAATATVVAAICLAAGSYGNVLYNRDSSPAGLGAVPPNKVVADINSMWLLSTATHATAQIKLYERLARWAARAIMGCSAQMQADFADKAHRVFQMGSATVKDLQRWLTMVINNFKELKVAVDWGKAKRGIAAAQTAPFIRGGLQGTFECAIEVVAIQFERAAVAVSSSECLVETFLDAPLIDKDFDMAKTIEAISARANADPWPALLAAAWQLPVSLPASISTRLVTGPVHQLVVALVGPKNGGKTTLFKRLAGVAQVESPWEALINGSSNTLSAVVNGALLAAFPGTSTGIPTQMPSHTAKDDVTTKLVVAFTVPADVMTAEVLTAAWSQFTEENGAGLFAVVVTKIDYKHAGAFGGSFAWDKFVSQLDLPEFEADTKCYRKKQGSFAVSGPWFHGYVGLDRETTRNKGVLRRAYAPSDHGGDRSTLLDSWRSSALAAVKQDGGLPGSQAERSLDIFRVSNVAQACQDKAFQNLVAPTTLEVGTAASQILRTLVKVGTTLPSNLQAELQMFGHHGYRQQHRNGSIAGLGKSAQARYRECTARKRAGPSKYGMYIDETVHSKLYALVTANVKLFQYPMVTPRVKLEFDPGHMLSAKYGEVWEAHAALTTTIANNMWTITDRTEFKKGGIVVLPGAKPGWLLSADETAGTYTGFAHIGVQSLFNHHVGRGMSLEFSYPARKVHAVVDSVCCVFSSTGDRILLPSDGTELAAGNGHVSEYDLARFNKAGFVCRSEYGHRDHARLPDTATSRHNGLQPGDVIVVQLDRNVFVPKVGQAIKVVLKAVPTTSGFRHIALGALRCKIGC